MILGNNHQWLQKPLDKRLMENLREWIMTVSKPTDEKKGVGRIDDTKNGKNVDNC